MKIGIVGAEAAKFTDLGRARAKLLIAGFLAPEDAVLVSGHCPLGGIDIWSEEEAIRLGRPMNIHKPRHFRWAPDGFEARNLLIASDSDVLHNIVVDVLPPGFSGRRFKECYHCHATNHVKSGGCWTAFKVEKLGKPAHWHIVHNF